MRFQFGKPKRTAVDYAVIGIVLFCICMFLTTKLKMSEKDAWKLIDTVQRYLLKKGMINDSANDYIIKDPKLLQQRVESDVDSAIRRYERWESSLPPRMTNKTILKGLKSPRFSETQRIIVRDAIYYECPGGIMGIRGVWVDKDSNCH